jgi:hypothetical protein
LALSPFGLLLKQFIDDCLLGQTELRPIVDHLPGVEQPDLGHHAKGGECRFWISLQRALDLPQNDAFELANGAGVVALADGDGRVENAPNDRFGIAALLRPAFRITRLSGFEPGVFRRPAIASASR